MVKPRVLKRILYTLYIEYMYKLLLTIVIVSLVATGCFLKKQPEVDRGAVIPLNQEETAERFGSKTENFDERVEAEDIDTSDWKTYRDERYGYQIKYPVSWSYSVTSADQVEFYDTKKVNYFEGGETSIVSLHVRQTEPNFSYDDWLKDWTAKREDFGGNVRQIKLDNVNAIQGVDYSGLQTVFYTRGYQYYINFSSVATEYKVIYESMLTSVDFFD